MSKYRVVGLFFFWKFGENSPHSSYLQLTLLFFFVSFYFLFIDLSIYYLLFFAICNLLVAVPSGRAGVEFAKGF